MSYRRIQCQRDGPVLVVSIAANGFDLDPAGTGRTNAEIKEDLLQLAKAATGPVVLDMTAVKSVAVDGFGILLHFDKHMAAAGHAWAVCVNDDLWQLFRVTRLDQRMRRSVDIPTAVRELICATEDAPPRQVD